MKLERTEKEIDEVLNACDEQTDKGGSRWPGISYEAGVSDAIRWLVGLTDDNPMEDV